MNNKSVSRSVYMVVAILCVFLIVAGIALLIRQKTLQEDAPEETSGEVADTSYSQFVELGNYKGLTVEAKLEEVSDEDIAEVFDNIVEQHGGGFADKTEGVIENGDRVSVFSVSEKTQNVESLTGIIGKNELPEGYDNALLGLELKEDANVDIKKDDDTYKVSIASVSSPVEVTDEIVASYEIEGVKSVKQLKNNIKNLLKDEYKETYDSEVREQLIEACYDNCTFKDMPDEYVAPFKELLKSYLDRLVESYKEAGEDVTYDDILEEIYDKDNISSLDEYLDLYGLQSARVYAMCEAIAKEEGLSAEEVDKYDYAARDWLDITGGDISLKEFLNEHPIETYEHSALLDVVNDYLVSVSAN